MRCPAATIALVLLATTAGGCGRASNGPGIPDRRPVAVDDRASCEYLDRVDLGVVGEDPASLDRSAAAIEHAATVATADLREALEAAASAYRRVAAGSLSADELRRDVVLDPIRHWEFMHCGHSR